MCIALNICPKSQFITLRLGHLVVVYDWLGLGPKLSTHRLDKKVWRDKWSK